MANLSPLTPTTSLNFNYFTTFTTQDLTDVSNLVTQLLAKLNTIQTGQGSAACQWLSHTVSRGTGAIAVDVYDVTNVLNGGKMGSPVLISSGTLSTTTDNVSTPAQVSAVVTLQAPYGTDVEFGTGTRPRARDRGRIFFGPLAGSGLAIEATTNRSYISSSTRTDLVQWVKAINPITSTPHTVVWNLGVWSRKNGAMKSLQEIWVDDRPDSTRRRAGRAGTKTVISA